MDSIQIQQHLLLAIVAESAVLEIFNDRKLPFQGIAFAYKEIKNQLPLDPPVNPFLFTPPPEGLDPLLMNLEPAFFGLLLPDFLSPFLFC